MLIYETKFYHVDSKCRHNNVEDCACDMTPSACRHKCEERQRERPMARDMNRCAVKNSCIATLANSLELSCLEIQDISFIVSLSKAAVTGCSVRCRLCMRSSCHAEGQDKRAILCVCVCVCVCVGGEGGIRKFANV